MAILQIQSKKSEVADFTQVIEEKNLNFIKLLKLF